MSNELFNEIKKILHTNNDYGFKFLEIMGKKINHTTSSEINVAGIKSQKIN